MNWKPYFGERLILEHPDGFFIIKPEGYVRQFPLFCTVCDHVMRPEIDKESYEKFSCCDSCATMWAYPNKEKWKEGWRPSQKDLLNPQTT